MYQLTQLAADRHRQQLAAAEQQRPAGRALALARATRRAERVSRRGESHPPPLAGPDVTVSRHPAPTGRPAVNAMSCQWANSRGWYW
jgi:hypothetical protein